MFAISIIIPVYNAEKYLERCINSIINQTIGFEKIELILVDDNSTDNSKEIIQEYSDKYTNIKSFFSQENHGFPGYGRNIGLQNASSEYIMFIDNDDEYEEDFCETVYNIIKNDDCDLVSANYKIIEDDVIIMEDNFSKTNENIHFKDDYKKLVKLNDFFLIPDDLWTKIFKKTIIKDNNIKFIENKLNEDSQFLFNYMYYANDIVFINYYGYKHYRDGENLSYFSSKNTLRFIESYYDLLELLREKYDEKIDLNHLFKNRIDLSLFRILLSSHQKCLLEKLYEFENEIEFNGDLNHFWTTFCNKLLLKHQINLVIILFKILKIIKRLIDFLRRKHVL